MLKSALWYAQNLGWSVFPVNGKIPYPGTSGFKMALKSSKEDIERLFSPFHSANIAVATGKVSGIFVLDIDVSDGKFGEESLDELTSKNGKFPHTVESITWSGGRQLFFKYPKDKNIDIRNSAGKIGKHLDIRANGGYVVVPPSIHNGQAYEWELSSKPNNCDIAEAPEWLIKLITTPEDVEKFKLPEGNIPSGNQDDTLFRLACSLRSQNFTPIQVEATLRESLKKCHQDENNPFTDKDIKRWIEGAFKYPDTQTALDYTDYFGKSENNVIFNDLWNSKLFYKKYGNDIIYCNRLGGWLLWDGKRWQKDTKNKIQAMAIDTVKDLPSYIKDIDEKSHKRFMAHINKSGGAASIKNMVQLLSSHTKLSQDPENFDSYSYLLNCNNGIYDLDKDVFVEHDRTKLLTKLAPVEYDPEAKCPKWECFLSEIFVGNTDIIKFMQRIIGYSLTDSIEEHAFFILHGNGRNGKSTLLKTIDSLLGDYAKNAPSSTLMTKKNDSIPNDVASLVGSRLVTCIETKKGKSLDEAVIKQATGGDKVTARFLRQEFFEFTPTFKIFFATNHKPDIHGTDEGIWERIKMIPFNFKISSEKRNPRLDIELKQELAGILNWSIEGFRNWKKDGLNAPLEVLTATDEYRTGEDIIGDFFSENMEITGNNNDVTPINDIMSYFREWCGKTGEEYNGKYIRKKEIREYISVKNYVYDRMRSGEHKGKMCVFGIEIKSKLGNVTPF